MASMSYSFIDVAVLDGVRERFAAGDALVILSTELTQIVWANGPGAELFGYSDIEAVVGADSVLTPAARRQIMATTGYPRIGQDRGIAVRLMHGLQSRVQPFFASEITMPDGEPAILLALPADAGPTDREAARRAIGGLREPGHFAAFVDARGAVEAATPGFGALGIEKATLQRLADELARAQTRLIKRIIPSASGPLPAGVARLRDEPARHLLIVIDESQWRQAYEQTEAAGAAGPAPRAGEPEAAVPEQPAAPHPEDTAEAGPVAAAAATAAMLASDGPRPSETEAADTDALSAEEGLALRMPAETPAASSTGTEPQQPDAETGPPEQVSDSGLFEAGIEPQHIESSAEAAGEVDMAAAPEAAIVPEVDRAAAPLRFAWRTDAQGRFSAISPEFVQAVGPVAGNVIGRSFREISDALRLDPYGEIAGLLERRDTWSGRAVSWPIDNTDLRVPVDLAALPVYARDRSFDGFRGFGVARMADVVVDMDAAFAGTPVPDKAGREIADEPDLEPAAAPEDPFQGEVPALVIATPPELRSDDKVVALAEHRAPIEKALTTQERTAFREIGDRLRQQDAPLRPAATAPAPAAEMPTEQPSAIGPAAPKPAEPEPHERGQAAATSPAPEPAAPAAIAVVETAGAPAAAAPALRPSTTELKVEGFMPSAFAGPAAEPRKPRQDTPILARLPVPLLIHSGDVLHYANAEFLELTGYASVEALAQAGGLGALFADSYAGTTDDDGDHAIRLKTRDGQEFPIEALLRSVPWNGGRALMLVVRRTGAPEEAPEPAPAPQPQDLASPDIAALKARVAEMRTIIDTATDGVILIDRDSTIRSISRPAEALFGFDTDEAAGKPFISLFAIESQRAARDYLNGLSDNGVASVLNDGREVIGREAQGRFIPLFMTIGKLPNDSGYCAVVRDITQWKRAEEELTQARALAERTSSQKTDFLARISHEIRTPLNAIIGFSELMLDERFGPVANDRYRDYLRDINRSGNHVLDLVNDLLDITKIEAGEQQMDYEAVSLNDTLAETVAMMQPQANRERVIIRSSFASKLPEVVADQRSVRQIALNILSNAVRFTPAGGQVIVSTAYEPSGDVIMRVRDTGIGMSAAEIEQALKPFKQVNALKRGRGDGTGLGLPLTKAMVEANRARFAITSASGEGTLVEVTFPSTRVLAG